MIQQINSGSVCFLNYNLAFGGTEKVIVSLANHLAASGRSVSILIMTPDHDFKDFLNPSVEVIHLNISSMKQVVPSLLKLLIRRKFDNFIANVWPLTALSFVVKICSRRTKLIYIEHCNLSEQFKSRGSLFKFIQNVSIFIFYKFSDKVISVSEGVKQDLINKGVKKEKIETIYNPIIISKVSAMDKSNPVVVSWLDSNKIKLIAVGRLKPQKNFTNLIKAFAIAKNKLGLDMSLLILGDGSEEKQLRNQIDLLNLHEDILLGGWVHDPLPYVKESDLFVLSSDYEGFGVVIAEAMSQGVNVVSTDCKSGPSEILQGDKFGTLCEVNNPASLADAIVQSLKNPIDSKDLIERAKDFSETKIGNLYEEMLI